MDEGVFAASPLIFMDNLHESLDFVCRLVLLRRQLGGQTVVLIIGDRDTAGQRDLGMLAWQWGKVITTALSASSL